MCMRGNFGNTRCTEKEKRYDTVWKKGKKSAASLKILPASTYYDNDEVKSNSNVKREALGDDDTVTNGAPTSVLAREKR